MRAIVALVAAFAAACSSRTPPAPAPPTATTDAATVPPLDELAAELVTRMTARGHHSTYDREHQRIHVDGLGIYLRNFYDEYAAATPPDRAALLERWSNVDAAHPPVPTSFEDARANLLPAIRAGNYFDVALGAAARGEPAPSPPTRPLHDYAAIALAIDSDGAMRFVSDGDLAA